MKKIWWQAGACLLLVILIIVIMHAFRHDKTQSTAAYDDPAAAGGAPSAYDHRYPIGRDRAMPGEAIPGQQPMPVPAPAYGGGPADRGAAMIAPGARPQDMGPAEDAPQRGMRQGEMAPPPETMDQDPGGPYEDGNPEDVPPPESLPDD